MTRIEDCYVARLILIRNKLNLLTAFLQRVLVLAFCTLLEVSRRFVEPLCPDMEIHLDGTNFDFINHAG